MTYTKKEKDIWNEAVKKTLSEVIKLDGMITDTNDRRYIYRTIFEKVSFKRKRQAI